MNLFRTMVLGVLMGPALFAQRSPDDNWPMFNRDLAGTRYSPLRQINAGNIARLTLAWSYRPGDHGGKAAVESMPLVVNGVMYLANGNRVVALDPETGRETWHYDLESGLVAGQRGVALARGPAVSDDARIDNRNSGDRAIDIISRKGRELTAEQVKALLRWLAAV